MSPARPKPSLLLSLHDVMPATRAQIDAQLQLLQHHLPHPVEAPQVTLLVVPGKNWSTADLCWLQGLARAGYTLAGHGWHHRAVAWSQRSGWHHLHSLVLSRDAAEHLSRTREQLLALVNASFCWFQQHDLPSPTLYVPPAWAPGALRREDWRATPYQQVELLSGILDVAAQRWQRAAVLGFEADTYWRAWSLGLSNRLNQLGATVGRLPLRIALHPHDHHLYLRDALIQMLQRCQRLSTYAALNPPSKPVASLGEVTR